jgi:hypothetical protein
VTTERLVTAPNDELIVPVVTRAAPRDLLGPTDVRRQGTEASPANARLVATTATTSTPEVLAVTRRDVPDRPAPAATEPQPDRRDQTVVTTVMHDRREPTVPRDPVRALRGHERPAMSATATRGLPGLARFRQMDAQPVRNVATTESPAIAVRASRRAAPDPTPETDRATRELVAVARTGVPVN